MSGRAFRRCAALLIALLPLAAGAQALDSAMADVEKIRNLKFTGPVKSETIDRKALSRYLRDQMEKSLPYPFDDYRLILESLRLIEPGTPDAESSMLELMEQQVLAFYDPLTHIYYAIDSPPPATAGMNALGLGDAVVVHELTHALQDQRFQIGRSDLAVRDDTDASLALHALIEGEATLVMMAKMVEPLSQTLQSLTADDRIVDAIAGAATAMTATAGNTPRYFVESLAIPYSAGLRFVIAAYRQGGWDRVNHVYDSPPQTMREILHPEEYLAGKRTANKFPLRPAVPVPHLLTVEHLGEWHWQFLVGKEGATGWTGDRVTVSQDARCLPTVLVETAWESPARAAAFRRAYEAFLDREKIDARFRVHENYVDVAYGSDDRLIEKFIPEVPFAMIDIDYSTLDDDVTSGAFRTRLEFELIPGFRALHQSGERLPTASHYAAQIAEIVSRGTAEPLHPELAFNVYQEILAACEHARATVLGELPS